VTPGASITRLPKRSLLRGAAQAGAGVALAVGGHLVDFGRLTVPAVLGRGSAYSAAHRRAQAALPAGRLALLADNALWLMEPGGPRRLASGTGGWLQDPAWSPDGAALAYTHVQFRPPTAATSPGGMLWPSGEVFAVRPSAGSSAVEGPTALLRREALNETLVSAVWSPDGATLYAVRRRPSPFNPTSVQSDILGVDLAGGGRSSVIATGDLGSAGGLGDVAEVAAGPDGSLAVLGTTGPAVTGVQDVALFHILPDGTRRELASTAMTAPVPGLDFLVYLRFSPDGRYLAFAAGEGPAGLAGFAGPAEGTGHAGLAGIANDSGTSTVARSFLSFGPGAASAHGARGWPWVADLYTGELRRVPVAGLDDLAGLVWLADQERLLVLDAQGLAVVTIADGTLARVEGLPRLAATALAYSPAV